MTATHQPLTADDLLPTGLLHRLGRRVFMHNTIDSTNAFLLAQAADAGDGAIAWSERQTAGRGRLGRRWEAPRGSSVLLSILLLEPPDSPLLSQGALLAAVAACEAIEATTDCTPAVRWPNDIVLHGRKLGGVLAESAVLETAADHAVPGARAVVIGVGINCLQQRGHFRGELAGRATSLECESQRPVARAAVAASLLTRLDHWLVACAAALAGAARMRAEWRRRCDDVGTRVTLEHDARVYTGTAIDIADDGNLIVELDRGGRRQFSLVTTTRAW